VGSVHKGKINTSPFVFSFLFPRCERGLGGHSFLGVVGGSLIHFQSGVVGKYVGRIIYATGLLLLGGFFGMSRVARGGQTTVGSAVKPTEASKHQECEGEPKTASELGFI